MRNSISMPAAILTLVTCLVVFTCVGCQEQVSSSDNKQVRLVANQNLELKEQLKEKDQEIQRQKDLVIECEKKNEQLQAQAGMAAESFVEMIQGATKALQEENNTLKERVKELESQLKE